METHFFVKSSAVLIFNCSAIIMSNEFKVSTNCQKRNFLSEGIIETSFDKRHLVCGYQKLAGLTFMKY